MRKIGIVGCGWLGNRIVQYLEQSCEFYITTRTAQKHEQSIQQDKNSTLITFSDTTSSVAQTWDILQELEVVIIAVTTPKRLTKTELVQRFQNIAQFIKGYQGQLFMMSSTGIYPNEVHGLIQEDTHAETLLYPSIYAVEQLMQTTFPQINILRLAGLMGDERYLSKYNITKDLGKGVNHVHYTDICRVVETMIQQNTSAKTYNVVAPLHPTKQDVINYQKGIEDDETIASISGKLINGTLLENELNFEYLKPNPKYFKN